MTKLKNIIGTIIAFLVSYGFTFVWTLIAAVFLLISGAHFFGGIALGWFICTNIEALKRLVKDKLK